MIISGMTIKKMILVSESKNRSGSLSWGTLVGRCPITKVAIVVSVRLKKMKMLFISGKILEIWNMECGMWLKSFGFGFLNGLLLRR